MGFMNFAYLLAILSGFVAACTGLYSKFLGEGFMFNKLRFFVPKFNDAIIFMLLYLGVIFLSVLMWVLFISALKLNKHTVFTMAVNNISNFIFSVRVNFLKF